MDVTYLLQSLIQHVDEAGNVTLVGSPWSASTPGSAALELSQDIDVVNTTKATDMLLGSC